MLNCSLVWRANDNYCRENGASPYCAGRVAETAFMRPAHQTLKVGMRLYNGIDTREDCAGTARQIKRPIQPSSLNIAAIASI